MDSKLAISVENVTKAFRLRGIGDRTLKTSVLDAVKGRMGSRRLFEALKSISFNVASGETLGIIGSNGAGKSTLLSIITGVMEPTSGVINTSGSIASLLELGAGFHPELTGRENIFLYGAVMGIPGRQMRDRFDTIVEFAGINEFIDQPVKYYSSGMYVRLGFSVAVEVDPDIILIDEVLAVGDAEFQRKCLSKMEEFRNRGKTMLIISHDLKTIQTVSDRILLLDEGRMEDIGSPVSVIKHYQDLTKKKNAKVAAREWGTGEVKIEKIDLFDGQGRVCDKFVHDGAIEVRISYVAKTRIEKPVFGFAIADLNGRLIYGSNTQIEKYDIDQINGGGFISLKINHLAMARGSYLFSFSVHSWDHKTNYHRLDNVLPFDVETEKKFEGVCCMPCSWKMKD